MKLESFFIDSAERFDDVVLAVADGFCLINDNSAAFANLLEVDVAFEESAALDRV